MEYYTLELCGLTRQLPLVFVGKNTRFASFSLLGDVELTQKIAEKMVEMLKPVQHDILICPEVKAVSLLEEISSRLGHKKFVVCRKSVKPYMVSPVILKPLPHFPKHVRQLVLDGVDAEILKNKKVIIIDDVISTGVTMRMMSKLMEKVGATVVARVAVLKQGEQFDKFENLLTLAELPVFKT